MMYLTNKYKYDKYYKKHFGMINKLQFGGSKEEFFTKWKSIENSGQFNCGIFISDAEPNKICKCEKYFHPDITKMIEKIGDEYKKFFPEIYETKTYDGNAYTIMEKLDGDITQFLLKYIPIKVLSEMSCDDKTKSDIWYIFDGSMNTTMSRKESLVISHDFGLVEHLYKNQHLISTYEGHELEKKFVVKMNNMYERLHDSRLTKDIYLDFIDRTKNYILYALNILYDAITTLHIKMFLVGFYYEDSKFDNLGYKLYDEPLENTFPIFGRHIKVLFLDWGSGLGIIDDDNIKYKLDDIIFNYTSGYRSFGIYGQHNLENANLPLYRGPNIMNLPNEIYEIITTDIIKLNLNIVDNVITIDKDINYFRNFMQMFGIIVHDKYDYVEPPKIIDQTKYNAKGRRILLRKGSFSDDSDSD